MVGRTAAVLSILLLVCCGQITAVDEYYVDKNLDLDDNTSSGSSSGSSSGTSSGTSSGCVTLGGAVGCDPLAGECAGAGSACDWTIDGNTYEVNGFKCFNPPNPQLTGQACHPFEDPTCTAGVTCWLFGEDQWLCSPYCCEHADCPSGQCNWIFSVPGATDMGICSL